MADFPDSVINFDRQVDAVSTIDAADVNLIYDEVEAIETFLIGSVGSQSVTQVVATVSLTGQTADITETEFDNTDTAGFYRINIYLVTEVADAAAGFVQVMIHWSDVSGQQTGVMGADLATLGDHNNDAPIVFYLASGSISYDVTHSGDYGTAQYALYIVVERLM